ncbi:hypothetical protein A7C91_05840 [Thermococcus piezophilus]|uniref:Uncharacterized protein n=1 Tax=Thermococcus piezophilus TaxID=1712654 RepID=A0A172WH16_9EURY|nr:hypothetical protein A7C91_05840 [Thermococcus piezophilus]
MKACLVFQPSSSERNISEPRNSTEENAASVIVISRRMPRASETMLRAAIIQARDHTKADLLRERRYTMRRIIETVSFASRLSVWPTSKRDLFMLLTYGCPSISLDFKA